MLKTLNRLIPEDPYGVLNLGETEHIRFGTVVDKNAIDDTVRPDRIPITTDDETPIDICPTCCVTMTAVGSVLYCPRCRFIDDVGIEPVGGGLDSYIQKPTSRRLLIAGPERSAYQRDLDRGAPHEASIARQDSVLREYKDFNIAYARSGHFPISMSVLSRAAEIYHDNLQRDKVVRRSNCRRSILAACLQQASQEMCEVREWIECVTFCQARSKGAARGAAFLKQRQLVSESKIITVDLVWSYICTVFRILEEDPEKSEPQMRAVEDLVKTMEAHAIATDSEIRSKVYGAVYEVMLRSSHWTPTISIKELCDRGNIRSHTVEKVRRQFADYAKIFEPVYRRHSLD